MTFHATVASDSSQGFFMCGTAFLPPRSLVKPQVSGNSGLQILENSNRFSLFKFENNIGSFVAGGNFGKFYTYAIDSLESQTTSTVYIDRLTMATAYVTAGNYRFSISFEWDMSQSGANFDAQVLLDGDFVVDTFSDYSVVTGYYKKFTSFAKLSLTDSEHVFILQVKTGYSNTALITKNAKMELFKIF